MKKYVIHVIQIQPPPISHSFFSKKEKNGGQVQISCVDANLVRVAPEHRDMGGHTCLCEGTLGQSAYFSK
jgi:hypothetical protein